VIVNIIIPCIFEENEERPLGLVVGFIGIAFVFHDFDESHHKRLKCLKK